MNGGREDELRVLYAPEVAAPGEAVDDEALARLYGWSTGLRVNVVATLDGSATGPDGLSGSINTGADRRVFALLRAAADVVLVGAGTVRAEGYGRVRAPREYARLRSGQPDAAPLCVVTASGELPSGLLVSGSGEGDLLVATTTRAPGLPALREAIGPESLLVTDADRVELAGLVADLRARGLSRVLCEGGPTLTRDLVGAGLVDEWCGTLVPRLVGGGGPRPLDGRPVQADLGLVSLLEAAGTIIGRWTVLRGGTDLSEEQVSVNG